MTAARQATAPTGIRLIDPHMHMWDLTRHYHGWLQDDPLPHSPAGDLRPIAGRSYLPDDYLADAADVKLLGTVHIECGLPADDQLSETDWLQSMADSCGVPSVIVAGAVLEHPSVAAMLEAQAARPAVRGIRQILNWHRDPLKTYRPLDLLENPAWRAGFALLARHGLSFDMQIYPLQMPAAARLAAAHPDINIVINHGGMPVDRDEDGIAAWRTGIASLAARPNVAMKISGFGMVDRDWSEASIRPFVLELIDRFGPDRTMFASNFPVDRLHGSFVSHFAAFTSITADFCAADRQRLFADTAAAVYRLP